MTKKTSPSHRRRSQGGTREQTRSARLKAAAHHGVQPRPQQLEERTLLSLGVAADEPGLGLPMGPAPDRAALPIEVVLINQDVPEAQAIAATAVAGVITVMYDPMTIDTAGLVQLLGEISAAHGGALIDHLALVAHGHAGQVDVTDGDVWNLATLTADAGAFQGLRSDLTADARIDLYACDVAAGPAGQTFVNQLAAATGAVISASDDPVGTAPGADFNWEYVTTIGPRPADLLSVSRLSMLSPFVLDDVFDTPCCNDSFATATSLNSGAIGDRFWTDLSIYHSSGFIDYDFYKFSLNTTGGERETSSRSRSALTFSTTDNSSSVCSIPPNN